MSSFSIFNLCSMERRSLRVCTVLVNCSEAFSVRGRSDCLHHFISSPVANSDAKNLKWDIPEENVQEAIHLCLRSRFDRHFVDTNLYANNHLKSFLGPRQIHLAKALRLHPRPGWQRFPVSKFALVALCANLMFVSLCIATCRN